jgi:hypothetical protein
LSTEISETAANQIQDQNSTPKQLQFELSNQNAHLLQCGIVSTVCNERDLVPSCGSIVMFSVEEAFGAASL